MRSEAYPRTIDFKKFKEIADEVGATFLPILRILRHGCGRHPSPWVCRYRYFYHLKTSSSKRWYYLRNNEELAKKIPSFSGIQGALGKRIAAKVVAGEALDPNQNIPRTSKNAKTLGETL